MEKDKRNIFCYFDAHLDSFFLHKETAAIVSSIALLMPPLATGNYSTPLVLLLSYSSVSHPFVTVREFPPLFGGDTKFA